MSVAARIEGGRGEWLADLYQAHARAVTGYCRQFLNCPEDAADATHEVFVRAIGSLQAAPRSPQARRWLITVAQNYCLDLMRRRRRMQSALTVLASDGEPQYESESDVVNRRLLDAVLTQLRPRERQALWQSAIEHRSVGEIATALGISYMAAAQVLHRARKHAAAVAAKLGALLGLAGANALRRRPRGLGLVQSLAAVAVAPLVIAIATPSSSGHAAGLAQRPHQVAAKAPAHAAAAGLQLVAGATTADVQVSHRRLLPKRIRSAVGSVISLLTQTIQQLTNPIVSATPPVSLPAGSTPPLPQLLPQPLPTLLPSRPVRP